MDDTFVSYLRVSTDRQGRSGLGIEAQRTAVASYLAGFGAEPVAEFVEVESGKRADRPELARALAECRMRKATLVDSSRARQSFQQVTRYVRLNVTPNVFCGPHADPAGEISRWQAIAIAADCERPFGICFGSGLPMIFSLRAPPHSDGLSHRAAAGYERSVGITFFL